MHYKQNERKWFYTKKKAQSRWYLTETIMTADYIDDLALLANILGETKSLLHSLEQAARCISLYMNSDELEFTCLKQDSAISTFNGKHLKLVDPFTYLPQ